MQAPFDIPADLDTPVSAYLKLGPLGRRFLLESVVGPEHQARYSFLGFGPARQLVLDDRGLCLDGRVMAQPGTRDELLDALRGALESAPHLAPTVPGLALQGGIFGATGYGLARRLEAKARARSAGTQPDLLAFLPSAVLVFDHHRRAAALLSDRDPAGHAALRQEVLAALRGPLPEPVVGGRFEAPRASLTREAFVRGVARVQEAILDGEVYQLVLSSRFEGRSDLSPLEVYRALRRLNPSPYMYLFEFDELSLVGASPEALVRLENGQATLQPIAGTRPRGDGEAADRALEEELLADPKEAAEHVMLVDLARNDLGRVARPGTIRVDPYRSIQRYSHVMHLVSGVRGELERGFDQFDLFAAAFPAGTVVGAPKIRAMELIDALEPEGRGLYAGTVGYFGHGNAMDQAICIRTLVFERGEYRFQTGAGVVADSRADAEYDEVLAKGGALRAALALAAEGL